MRIAEARAYRQWQPFVDGTYACSGGVAEGFDSTIVALVAEDGTTGFGEAAPLGAFYAPAFPAGVRAGVAELLPLVDRRRCDRAALAVRRLDAAMMGQPAAKAAIDMAACDLAARLAGVPLAEALGGRDGETVALYRSVVSEAPAAMAERARGYARAGYRRIQVKVGADPLEDAERLRAVHDASRRARRSSATPTAAGAAPPRCASCRRRRDLDYVLEQPCGRSRSARSCARAASAHWRWTSRSRTSSRCSPAPIAAGCDAVTIKLARVGGVTRAALMRDAACELGLLVTVEDTGGSDIATAAMAHVSLSTPAALAAAHGRLQRVGDGRERDRHAGARGGLARRARRGRDSASTVDERALGEPFARRLAAYRRRARR